MQYDLTVGHVHSGHNACMSLESPHVVVEVRIHIAVAPVWV